MFCTNICFILEKRIYGDEMDKRKKNGKKREIEKKSEIDKRRKIAKSRNSDSQDKRKSKKVVGESSKGKRKNKSEVADSQKRIARKKQIEKEVVKTKAKAIGDIKVSDKKEKFNQYKFVIKELTAREIKRKYSRSVLGIVWSVLNPLLSMVVISLVFTQIFERSIVNFPIYYLCGSLLWELFTTATKSAMTTFVDNKQMLIKVKLPMQVFILARVYTALVNLEYSLIGFVLMLFVFQVNLKWTMLFVPVIIIFLLLFSIGISYILATAYVFFGDVKHLYSVFLKILLYCSAIFYPIDRIDGLIRIVVTSNPIFNFIDALRKVVILGELPTSFETIRMMLWGTILYLIGYSIFKRNKNAIMQKI